MSITFSRREFVKVLSMTGALGALSGCAKTRNAGESGSLYDLANYGNARLMHFTDCHAQLLPVYFREPNVNLGFGGLKNQPPHLVGEHLLKHVGIKDKRLEHAFTYRNFADYATQYGKMGGFAHLSTLVKNLRHSYRGDSLLLDGGDTWQGSGTSYKTRGMDMVRACNLLGVDIMTGHWEFTYLEDEVLANIAAFNGEFIAHNVKLTEEALFDEAPAHDYDTGHAFKPYVIKEMGGQPVAFIGQAFPYTPIANPSRFIPNWTFGIRDEEMQQMADQARSEGAKAVIVVSHNGMDVDKKMASRVTGVDAILGGHTHDAVPQALEIANPGGTTLVINSGSNGQFLGVLDLDIGASGVKGYQFTLLPVFADLLPADKEMQALIDEIRAPHGDWLNEELAVSDDLLYRRGNFNGTFDQVICDGMRAVLDAQIALSPGFRWGTSVLPGSPITMDDLLTQTCMTYPETYVREMKGEDLKLILEDVADNLFNEDPYYQQGGDMVRVGGMDYTIDPLGSMGGRITDMRLDNGVTIEAGKSYRVAGWATVGSKSPGEPIWDVVAEYLRSEKTVAVKKLNTPKIAHTSGNKGIADYAG